MRKQVSFMSKLTLFLCSPNNKEGARKNHSINFHSTCCLFLNSKCRIKVSLGIISITLHQPLQTPESNLCNIGLRLIIHSQESQYVAENTFQHTNTYSYLHFHTLVVLIDAWFSTRHKPLEFRLSLTSTNYNGLYSQHC